MRSILTLWILVSLSAYSGYGQTTQEIALANQYLDAGEIEKAVRFFERFHRNEPSKIEYFQAYITCLTLLGEDKIRLQTVKNQVKKFPESGVFRHALYNAILSTEGQKKAEKELEQSLKSLPPNFSEFDALGILFIQDRNPELAAKVYMFAADKFGQIPALGYRVMETALLARQYGRVASQFITMLNAFPAEFASLQSRLSTILDEKPNADINVALKDALKIEIQKDRNSEIFSEMLLWLFIQEKDFNQALSVAKALDKKTKSDGVRVMDLARVARENKVFKTAETAYQFIIASGKDNPNYLPARMGMIEIQNDIINDKPFASQEELLTLEKNYKETIDFLGPYPQAIGLKIKHARLLGFKLGNPIEAIKILDGLENERISPQDLALARMEKADLLILTNELWEPTLIYGSIEKQFPHDLLGQEAKFRNARLCWFRGEMEWARQQAKVLKTATSKLIANDAMELSLFIGDFGGPDSTHAALRAYSQADLLRFKGKNLEAIQILETLLLNHPNHDIVPHTFAAIAENYLILDQPKNAENYLLRAAEHPLSGIFADRFWFKLATLYRKQLNQPQRASEIYFAIFVDFPASIYAAESRHWYRFIQNNP